MTNSPILPRLTDVLQSVRASSIESFDKLDVTLTILFEASPILHDELVPSVGALLKGLTEHELPVSYDRLVDLSLKIVHGWGWEKQAKFVGGHPRIGEAKALSALSAKEQGQTSSTDPSAAPPNRTPPEVLERLSVLNAAYEKLYPGLIYITFVNGRSRSEVKDELESKLRAEGIKVGADGAINDGANAHEIGSEPWKKEITRAVDDVGKIAKSRLASLKLE